MAGWQSGDRTSEAFKGLLLSYRGRTGLTQRALAARVGVSVRSIQDWEAGAAYPSAQALVGQRRPGRHRQIVGSAERAASGDTQRAHRHGLGHGVECRWSPAGQYGQDGTVKLWETGSRFRRLLTAGRGEWQPT